MYIVFLKEVLSGTERLEAPSNQHPTDDTQCNIDYKEILSFTFNKRCMEDNLGKRLNLGVNDS